MNIHTLARIRRVFWIWRKLGGYIVVPCDASLPGTGKRFCDLVQSWFVSRGVPRERIFVREQSDTAAWNSLAEVAEARHIIDNCELLRREARVYAVSTWWHLPRLWLCWWKCGGGLMPRLVPAYYWKSFTAWMFQEPLKIAKTLSGTNVPWYVPNKRK